MLQNALAAMWSRCLPALLAFQGEDSESQRSTWLISAARHLTTVAQGIFSACVSSWMDAQPSHSRFTEPQSLIIELCLIFSVAWTIRALQRSLHDPAEEAALGKRVEDSLKAAGFNQLPQGRSIWECTIIARVPMWAPWQARSPLKLGEPVPQSMPPSRETNLCFFIPTISVLSQHSLTGLCAAAGGSALLAASHSCDLHTARIALRQCAPDGMATGEVQCVYATGSAVVQPTHLWVRSLLLQTCAACGVLFCLKFTSTSGRHNPHNGASCAGGYGGLS